MATNEEIQDAISDALAKPKRVRTSTAEVEQQSIKDLLDAEKRIASREAAGGQFFGARVRKARHTRDGC